MSPSEIENLLIQHPSVKDVGVVGVADERVGEVPLAFVVKQAGREVTGEELIAFVESNVGVCFWYVLFRGKMFQKIYLFRNVYMEVCDLQMKFLKIPVGKF